MFLFNKLYLRVNYRLPAYFPGCMLAATLFFAACERPFVDPPTPDVEVLTDLSTVFSSSSASIQVAIDSPQQITQAAINETPLVFNAGLGVWVANVPLERGLNTLRITASDDFDRMGIDTAYAVRFPVQSVLAPQGLPQPRGGHSATILADGTVLVAGGAASAGGIAQADAFLLEENRIFRTLSTMLNVARTGHTATLLPDGRVIILGGSNTDDVNSVSQLVETVEIYDPVDGSFQELPFEGQPIRRTLHTATVEETADGVLVQLYGGRGDINYNEPRLGTRDDLRTFRYTGTSLVALNTLASASRIDGISGHSWTPLAPVAPGDPGRYLITGTFFGSSFVDQVSFVLDYTNPVRTTITDVLPTLTPRTRHAATLFGPGLVLVAGGLRADENEILGAPELYADEAGRFFRFPEQIVLLKRYGHTATLISEDRILVLGGFTATGNSLRRGELIFNISDN